MRPSTYQRPVKEFPISKNTISAYMTDDELYDMVNSDILTDSISSKITIENIEENKSKSVIFNLNIEGNNNQEWIESLKETKTKGILKNKNKRVQNKEWKTVTFKRNTLEDSNKENESRNKMKEISFSPMKDHLKATIK